MFDDFPDYSREKDVAKWYNSDDGGNLRQSVQLKVFPNHIPLPMGKGGISEGDMGVAEISRGRAETNVSAIVKDISVCIRLFEGYDWLDSYMEGEYDVWGKAKAGAGNGRLSR